MSIGSIVRHHPGPARSPLPFGAGMLALVVGLDFVAGAGSTWLAGAVLAFGLLLLAKFGRATEWGKIETPPASALNRRHIAAPAPSWLVWPGVILVAITA